MSKSWYLLLRMVLSAHPPAPFTGRLPMFGLDLLGKLRGFLWSSWPCWIPGPSACRSMRRGTQLLPSLSADRQAVLSEVPWPCQNRSR